MVVENTKEFARVFNAEILLLRVIEDIPIRSAPLLAIDKPWIAKTKRNSEKIRRTWMKMTQERIVRELAKENIKVTPKVLIGRESSPAEQVVI